MPSARCSLRSFRVTEEGYVEGYTVEDAKPQKTLITLKYGKSAPRLSAAFVAFPSLVWRIYPTAEKLPRVLVVLVLQWFPLAA